MSTLAEKLEAIAAIPRAEIASRASAWPEAQLALAQAAAEVRASELIKQSSPEMSTLAARIMGLEHQEDIATRLPYLDLLTAAKSLAGSVLSQDQTPGQQEPAGAPVDNARAAIARNLAAAQREGQAHPLVAVVKDGE